jgi:DNA-binding transcriptional LysR family regulator
MDIDIRLLRHAAALASEGSFAKAARVVHLSQPALSRSIQELERRAGMGPLFERDRSGIIPSDMGRIFLHHAAKVLASAGDMSREIDLAKGLDTGELVVGTGFYPSRLFMDRALSRLLRPGSGLRIRVVQDSADGILARLRRREIDVGVDGVHSLEAAADMKLRTLSIQQGLLIARRGHPLGRKKNIRIEDVVTYPLVSSPAAHSGLAALSQADSALGRDISHHLARWIPAVTVEDVTLMKQIVAATDGVTVLSAYLVRDEVTDGRLTVLPFATPWLKVPFFIMHLANRTLSPLGEAFARHVIEADAEVQAEEASILRAWSAKPRK